MVNRFIVHVKNFKVSIKWIFYNYIKFKNHLELKGYYTLNIYKIWLWKKDARYFKVYNTKGECFFIKMKSEQSIISESRYLNYIYKRNFKMNPFYPKLIKSNISEFNYNIYRNIDGKKLSDCSFMSDIVEQMKKILDFLKEHKIVHRDVRPHNIILKNNAIILLDFEHCAINGKTDYDTIDLNENYSPSERIWDDAFSFKKIIDEYFKNEELKNNEFYKNICDMVGELEYEMV